jgi:uncharacterized RDD family membrane protein YckC
LAAPDKLTIDTPEQIALEFPLAGVGSRFLALAIDTLIQIAVLVVLVLINVAAMVATSIAFREFLPWVQAVFVLCAFVLYYAYFAVFEALWSGQTPGKRQVGLRVISSSGRPITAVDAIIRNLLRIVDQIPGIYGVGILSVFVTGRNQRLGDLAAGTVVVHERRISVDQVARAPASSGAPLGAHRLSPEEIQAIETFLQRRDGLPYDMREQSGRRLAQHVRVRLAIQPALHQPDEPLLEQAVAEYRSRGLRR